MDAYFIPWFTQFIFLKVSLTSNEVFFDPKLSNVGCEYYDEYNSQRLWFEVAESV